MSIKNVGVLAFASAAAAAAAGHGHQHARLHAYGTGSSSSAAAIPTGLPACWGTCFQEAGVSSPDALCDDEMATNCIKKTCATEDFASYEAWLKKQCNSAPYPSGSNSTVSVGPTGTGYTTLPSGYSTSLCTETSTLIYKTTTAYSTYVITHTLSPSAPGGYGDASSDVPVSPVTQGSPGGYGPGAPSGTPNSPISGGDEECSEVTVTTTERTTVTVTAGEGSAPSSYVSEATTPAEPSTPAEVPTSYAAPSTTSATEGSGEVPSSYVSEAGEAPTSWAAPSSYGPPSSYETPSSAAPTTEAAPSSYAQTSTKSSAPEQSSPPTYDSGFRGKRGIAYNDSSMVVPALMDSGKVGWASNWEGIAKGFEHSDITYIPTLHSGDSYWTGMWTEQAEAAISQGLPYLFGPNEPDIPSQANMGPEECANFWREWMEPYAGRIGLVAPSVSSGVGEGIGQAWLDEFMGYCSDCTFDAVNQHWYNSEGNDLDNFKMTIDGAAKYGKPVFVGEFGAIGSDEDISSFIGDAMSYMDGNDAVIGYAYFMAYEGLLVNGDALSPYGEMYCNGE